MSEFLIIFPFGYGNGQNADVHKNVICALRFGNFKFDINIHNKGKDNRSFI